jgi:acetoacetate decarboxylase
MKETNILTLPSMPIASPSYRKGAYRFIAREF